jgi:hypothetical protein
MLLLLLKSDNKILNEGSFYKADSRLFNTSCIDMRIQEVIDCTNSRFQFHEFTWSWNREFVIKLKSLKSWISTVNYFMFTHIYTTCIKREFVKLKSLIREVEIANSWSWNREFVKLKWWIHKVELWWWNCEFMKRKSWIIRSWNREFIFSWNVLIGLS